jgi:hypothetical protein
MNYENSRWRYLHLRPGRVAWRILSNGAASTDSIHVDAFLRSARGSFGVHTASNSRTSSDSARACQALGRARSGAWLPVQSASARSACPGARRAVAPQLIACPRGELTSASAETLQCTSGLSPKERNMGCHKKPRRERYPGRTQHHSRGGAKGCARHRPRPSGQHAGADRPHAVHRPRHGRPDGAALHEGTPAGRDRQGEERGGLQRWQTSPRPREDQADARVRTRPHRHCQSRQLLSRACVSRTCYRVAPTATEHDRSKRP